MGKINRPDKLWVDGISICSLSPASSAVSFLEVVFDTLIFHSFYKLSQRTSWMKIGSRSCFPAINSSLSVVKLLRLPAMLPVASNVIGCHDLAAHFCRMELLMSAMQLVHHNVIERVNSFGWLLWLATRLPRCFSAPYGRFVAPPVQCQFHRKVTVITLWFFGGMSLALNSWMEEEWMPVTQKLRWG